MLKPQNHMNSYCRAFDHQVQQLCENMRLLNTMIERTLIEHGFLNIVIESLMNLSGFLNS